MIYNSIQGTTLMCLTRDDSTLNHFQQVVAFAHAGAKIVQLRAKTIPITDLFQQAKSAVELCKKHGCKLIINDDYQLAQKVDADGVHLGLNDASVEVVRSFLPRGKLIGKTVHSVKEAKDAVLEKPDYIGLGPFRHSSTKKDLQPVLSEQDFKNIIDLLYPIPVFLIGGLTLNDFNLIDKFEIQGLALCSSLFPLIDGNLNLCNAVNRSTTFANASSIV